MSQDKQAMAGILRRGKDILQKLLQRSSTGPSELFKPRTYPEAFGLADADASSLAAALRQFGPDETYKMKDWLADRGMAVGAMPWSAARTFPPAQTADGRLWATWPKTIPGPVRLDEVYSLLRNRRLPVRGAPRITRDVDPMWPAFEANGLSKPWLQSMKPKISSDLGVAMAIDKSTVQLIVKAAVAAFNPNLGSMQPPQSWGGTPGVKIVPPTQAPTAPPVAAPAMPARTTPVPPPRRVSNSFFGAAPPGMAAPAVPAIATPPAAIPAAMPSPHAYTPEKAKAQQQRLDKARRDAAILKQQWQNRSSSSY